MEGFPDTLNKKRTRRSLLHNMTARGSTGREHNLTRDSDGASNTPPRRRRPRPFRSVPIPPRRALLFQLASFNPEVTAVTGSRTRSAASTCPPRHPNSGADLGFSLPPPCAPTISPKLVPKLDDSVPSCRGDPARLQRVPRNVDARAIVVAL